jgi:hypothetical protein
VTGVLQVVPGFTVFGQRTMSGIADAAFIHPAVAARVLSRQQTQKSLSLGREAFWEGAWRLETAATD